MPSMDSSRTLPLPNIARSSSLKSAYSLGRGCYLQNANPTTKHIVSKIHPAPMILQTPNSDIASSSIAQNNRDSTRTFVAHQQTCQTLRYHKHHRGRHLFDCGKSSGKCKSIGFLSARFPTAYCPIIFYRRLSTSWSCRPKMATHLLLYFSPLLHFFLKDGLQREVFFFPMKIFECVRPHVRGIDHAGTLQNKSTFAMRPNKVFSIRLSRFHVEEFHWRGEAIPQKNCQEHVEKLLLPTHFRHEPCWPSSAHMRTSIHQGSSLSLFVAEKKGIFKASANSPNGRCAAQTRPALVWIIFRKARQWEDRPNDCLKADFF